MSIELLEFQQFRNIRHVKIEPSPTINMIFGNNGEGKTSFLEGIYYLSLGRSFRSHLFSRIIQYEKDDFTLFAKVSGQSIGIFKNQHGEGQVKLAGEPVKSTAELTHVLPVQLINPDTYALLNDGPKVRREFMDWGVFHVEPRFLKIWQEMQRSLKQRNLALKMRAPKEEIDLWNPIFSVAASKIDGFRAAYVDALLPRFAEVLSNLIEIEGLTVTYRRGWPDLKDLGVLLSDGISNDLRLGHTYYGPHRADLDIRIDGVPAKDVLSRGQQKLFVYALRLAQGVLLTEQTKKPCIYLIDDLPAELDVEKREAVLKMLLSFDSQVFLTAIEAESLSFLLQDNKAKVFHVEHGDLSIHVGDNAEVFT